MLFELRGMFPTHLAIQVNSMREKDHGRISTMTKYLRGVKQNEIMLKPSMPIIDIYIYRNNI